VQDLSKELFMEDKYYLFPKFAFKKKSPDKWNGLVFKAARIHSWQTIKTFRHCISTREVTLDSADAEMDIANSLQASA